MNDWPPHYTVRYSKRAKNMSLRLYAGSGLEVVVPSERRSHNALKFLNEHRDWVEKQASKLKIILTKPLDAALPAQIDLRAINQVIEVVAHPIVSATRTACRHEKNKIILYGAIYEFSSCVSMLTAWLKKQANHYLTEWLNELSVTCDLPFRQCSIRAQKTIWGSCSSDHNIQLNYKILFLPRELARYIMIHELCHTVHMNHSKSFWKLVAKYVPDFRQYVKQLREADQYIPAWLLHSK